MRTMVILFALSFGAAAHAAQSCEDWFRSLRLAGTKDCELKCAMAENDMGSFDCSGRCEEFCKSTKDKSPCKLDDFWLFRLQGKTEPFSPLAGGELAAVKNTLSRVPKSFRPSHLKSFVRASGSGGIANAFNAASSSDEYVILFPRAFSNLEMLPRIITHELSHFLIENEWKQAFKEYKKISGWTAFKEGNGHRAGDFVDADGKFSPEEDFANNLEFYLFEPKTLGEKSPEIFKWIKRKLGAQLKLEKGCHDGK